MFQIDKSSGSSMESWADDNGWHVKINPISRIPQSWFEETVKVAKTIYENRTGKIYICYSGGVDSEFVLSLYKWLKIPVTPVILVNEYNQTDVQWATRFCESKCIMPIKMYISFDNFIKSGRFRELAEKYKCASYELTAVIDLISKLDGTVIQGANDQILLKRMNNAWCLMEDEPNYVFPMIYKDYNLAGTSNFFNYTSEQVYAFLTHPVIKNVVFNESSIKNISSTKINVYNDNQHFRLTSRKKLTGFESVKNSEIMNHPDIKWLYEKYMIHRRICLFDYETLIHAMSNQTSIILKNDEHSEFNVAAV